MIIHVHNVISRKEHFDYISLVVLVQHVGYMYIFPVSWDPLDGGQISLFSQESFLFISFGVSVYFFFFFFFVGLYAH